MPEPKPVLPSWHQALSIVCAGLDPAGPLPDHVTEKHFDTLERLAGQAKWRLKTQTSKEKPRG